MTLAPSPKPPTMPAVQVRQYSWHHYAKNDVSDKRREFVGTNKRTNRDSLFLSQQKPLVSRVHLMKVVRKIGQQERSRGKHLTDSRFKNTPLKGGKNVTSSLLPGRRVEGGNASYSVMCEYNSSGISLVNHEYPHISDKYNLECSKMQEKEREEECKLPGSTDYDVMDDEVLNGDVTLRVPDINRLIARKRYVPRKRSLRHSVGSFERLLRVYSRIVTFITLLLVMVRNVLGGLINIKRYERKSTVGNSSSLPLSGPLSASGFRELLFLYLRKLSATILGINKELWTCLMIKVDWNANKRLKRRREVLHNTRMRGESSWYERFGYSHS